MFGAQLPKLEVARPANAVWQRPDAIWDVLEWQLGEERVMHTHRGRRPGPLPPLSGNLPSAIAEQLGETLLHAVAKPVARMLDEHLGQGTGIGPKTLERLLGFQPGGFVRILWNRPTDDLTWHTDPGVFTLLLGNGLSYWLRDCQNSDYQVRVASATDELPEGILILGTNAAALHPEKLAPTWHSTGRNFIGSSKDTPRISVSIQFQPFSGSLVPWRTPVGVEGGDDLGGAAVFGGNVSRGPPRWASSRATSRKLLSDSKSLLRLYPKSQKGEARVDQEFDANCYCPCERFQDLKLASFVSPNGTPFELKCFQSHQSRQFSNALV